MPGEKQRSDMETKNKDIRTASTRDKEVQKNVSTFLQETAAVIQNTISVQKDANTVLQNANTLLQNDKTGDHKHSISINQKLKKMKSRKLHDERTVERFHAALTNAEE